MKELQDFNVMNYPFKKKEIKEKGGDNYMNYTDTSDTLGVYINSSCDSTDTGDFTEVYMGNSCDGTNITTIVENEVLDKYDWFLNKRVIKEIKGEFKKYLNRLKEFIKKEGYKRIENLKVDWMEDDRKSLGYCLFHKDRILINEDFNEIGGNYYDKKVLKELDLEVNEINLFYLIALHEIGHYCNLLKCNNKEIEKLKKDRSNIVEELQDKYENDEIDNKEFIITYNEKIELEKKANEFAKDKMIKLKEKNILE